MKIITGLGNPGAKYENTRHNVGFITLDYLAKKLDLTFEKNKKFNAFVVKKGDVLYAKPLTFMNDSGICIAAIMSYYKMIPKKLGFLSSRDSDLSETLTVIHDDLDIEFGATKISVNSRSAGHNGVESIIKNLKTKNFQRIRIGIKGNKPERMPAKNYVLSKFTEEELETIDNLLPQINI